MKDVRKLDLLGSKIFLNLKRSIHEIYFTLFAFPKRSPKKVNVPVTGTFTFGVKFES